MDYSVLIHQDRYEILATRIKELEAQHFLLALQHRELLSLVSKHGVTDNLSQQITNTKAGLSDFACRINSLRELLNPPATTPEPQGEETAEDRHAEQCEKDGS